MTTALVTGASGGIGAAICRALAARGVTLALHYQSGREAAEATRRSLEGDGHRLVQADLGDPKVIEQLWKDASAARRIDIVVNNAGIFPNHPPLNTEFEDWAAAWQRTLAINLLGPAHLSHFAARTMVGPEEVAEVVAFCSLDAPASLTGAILDVNGASYLRS